MDLCELRAAAVAKIKPEPDTCKGLYFRYRTAMFPTGRGGFKTTTEFTPLLRMSCKNVECDTCAGIHDTLADTGYEIEIDPWLRNGDIAEFRFEHNGPDWESGAIEDWWIKAVKYEPPEV